MLPNSSSTINITLPDQFQWKRNGAAGNEFAVLYGDPDRRAECLRGFRGALDGGGVGRHQLTPSDCRGRSP
jgi:hypothetical protein